MAPVANRISRSSRPEHTYSIREARSPEDLAAIHRFRYHVFHELQGKQSRDLCHAKQTFAEDNDFRFAIHLMVEQDGEVLASLRTRILDACPTVFGPAAGTLYRSLRERGPCATTDRLMLAPRVRRTGLFKELVERAYLLGLHTGLAADLSYCELRLVPV